MFFTELFKPFQEHSCLGTRRSSIDDYTDTRVELLQGAGLVLDVDNRDIKDILVVSLNEIQRKNYFAQKGVSHLIYDQFIAFSKRSLHQLFQISLRKSISFLSTLQVIGSSWPYYLVTLFQEISILTGFMIFPPNLAQKKVSGPPLSRNELDQSQTYQIILNSLQSQSEVQIPKALFGEFTGLLKVSLSFLSQI